MEDKSQTAKDNFLKGYNCSQSVLLAFAAQLGLEDKTALKIASSFGGGMGAQREVCGAVSGMLMALGLKYGYDAPKDFTAKQNHYALVQKLCNKFKEQNGSIVCRELLGLKEAQNTKPQERSAQYYKKRPCAELVAMAAQILQEELCANH